jgi:hypothetical protein
VLCSAHCVIYQNDRVRRHAEPWWTRLSAVDNFSAGHPFGNAQRLNNQYYWSGLDIVRGNALNGDGLGGQLLDGFDGIYPFGNAGALSVSAQYHLPGSRLGESR